MNKKLTIQAYKTISCDVADKIGELTMQINPEKYTLNRSINYQDSKVLNDVSESPSYKQTQPSTLSFEVLFDGTGIIPTGKKKVKERIEELENLVYFSQKPKDSKLNEPLFLKVIWGSLFFQGRLTSLNWTYTLFAPSGEPIRAKANLSLTEAISEKEAQKKIEAAKNDGEFVVFKTGDSLIGLCMKKYKKAGYACIIASVNNLVSFRDIKPGTSLWFPKL